MSAPKSAEPTRRDGVTLVEVIAAIALVGSLLALSFMANAAHLRQAQRANDKQLATALLDRLIADWSRSEFRDADFDSLVRRHGLLSPSAGEARRRAAPATNNWTVRTERRKARSIPQAEIVRLAVWSATSDSPLAWLEIIREDQP